MRGINLLLYDMAHGRHEVTAKQYCIPICCPCVFPFVVLVLVIQSCLTLCDPMDYSPQAPLSMEFPRQEYWDGLPFPSPGDLPHPGIELRSPELQADSLTFPFRKS